jgi:N-methyl-L-tryptophan oxidase
LPDKDFIIDRHPAFPNVLLAGGFSGHGFKFASVICEVAAKLLLEGGRFELSPFALSRFSK